MMDNNIIKELEFKEFLGKLKDCMRELNNYCDKNSGIDADIASDIEIIIMEDVVNDKREHNDKIKNIIRLYHIADFIYGFTFHKDEFNTLSKIMLNIMTLIEDYGFLDY